MLPFEILILICILCSIFSLIFFIITVKHIKKGHEKKAALSNAGLTFLGITLTIVTFLNIEIPPPILLPLNNETTTYDKDLEITITTEDISNAIKTYYTLDGSDPKDGSLYDHEIIISESTTVAARNHFLWWWSDVTKSGYEFEEGTPDNLLILSDERPSYSLQEINDGILKEKVTFNSIVIEDTDYDWYQQTYNENNIPDDTYLNEFDFVNTREYKMNYSDDYLWDNEIIVEDGKSYIIRMYIHNNNPNVIAEDTRVWFDIPSKSDKQLQINGYITSSNAVPSLYYDSVTFHSDTPFHFEYDYASAALGNDETTNENNSKW